MVLDITTTVTEQVYTNYTKRPYYYIYITKNTKLNIYFIVTGSEVTRFQSNKNINCTITNISTVKGNAVTLSQGNKMTIHIITNIIFIIL